MPSKRARDGGETEEKTFDWGIDIPAKKRKRDTDAAEGNADVKKTKKDKKEKKDKKDKKDKYKQESRKEKKDKKKDLQDLPEEDDTPMDDGVLVKSQPQAEPEMKKEKKSKKEKNEKKAAKETNGDVENESKTEKKVAKETNGDIAVEAKTEKKDKKKKKAKKENKDEPTTDAAETREEPADKSSGIDLPAADGEKQDRHIVFVGNLPFTATATTISAHFASLEPIGVRCMKNKDDDKPCKGFAFVEFGKVWHMRTCLDKFHHSMFDDGVSPGRKINVELTAGGGGKTKQRQEKIRAKNEKLDDNRAKRIEKEKTAKKDGDGAKPSDNGGMHPSRLARLPGFGQ